jgi:hypothetical protein
MEVTAQKNTAVGVLRAPQSRSRTHIGGLRDMLSSLDPDFSEGGGVEGKCTACLEGGGGGSGGRLAKGDGDGAGEPVAAVAEGRGGRGGNGSLLLLI